MCLAISGKVLTRESIGGAEVGKDTVRRDHPAGQSGLVPEARVGDYAMVHVGFAISRVDAEEAARTYQILESMGLLESELPPTEEAK